MSITTEKFNNETWFKISNVDSLRPFFISVVSDSNHWMFISSNGGLTAGRKNSEFALFPYYTVDKIHELAHTAGSKTIFQVQKGDQVLVWEPFSETSPDSFELSRNLYKNRFGNKIRFEEINHDLGLTFSYEWKNSHAYGFVKQAKLKNDSKDKVAVKVLDGIQNVMPYGISSDLQAVSSNLADAYKRSELVKESGLGIYALSAIIVDKAEPSEALKANVVWSSGLKEPEYLLSSQQVDSFRMKDPIEQEEDIKGERGAYFVKADLELEGSTEKSWAIIANVNLDQAQVIQLNKDIREEKNLLAKVQKDVERGTDKLMELISGADGLQLSEDLFKNTRHYSNVLFNIMRGGTFDHNYQIEKQDFTDYLRNASASVWKRNSKFVDGLNTTFDKFELNNSLESVDDPDLIRLAKEYLPLKFSRRHGDPSRPWNKFSINTHSEVDGSKILDYEGNWRDIFQNWEALVHSYPGFVDGMLFKFLNATTFDGYNPYRVTKGGFDWEIIEPDDPWSYIGYWGDHQIIYLLKFLEFYKKYQPETFQGLLEEDLFVYANVPYRIKPYADIAKDPKNTIDFDKELDHSIREKVSELGADGALLSSKKEELHRVNFLEKILATVLSKVSNFIPEGGIWMNTQRPEWNDANNALVGNGVSMVTLYYLRRFLNFMEPVMEQAGVQQVSVSEEMNELFNKILHVLEGHKGLLEGDINDTDRKKVTDALGKAGSAYREKIYEAGFSGNKVTLELSDIRSFIKVTLDFVEHTIRANRRDDNLYHAYNLMSMEKDGISISYLDEMLEGQVSVLSAGYLDSKEALQLLDSLRNSALYREDQQSYILYPNKNLPGFLQRNNIPKESVDSSALLKKLVADENFQVIKKDAEGGYHFNGNFKNAGDLKVALQALKNTDYAPLVEKEQKRILEIFEEVFNHKSFTGRSGTFFAYEGLGSIYWHMVSKLHLAAYEVYQQALEEDADADTIQKLLTHFDEIGEGIGIKKKPEVYGAFPTDPYSHTPQHRGAQQPGMTGQVKEDILVRFGELGVSYDEGKIRFTPSLLKREEFTNESKEFNLVSLKNEPYKLTLPENSLGFTCCQVPVVYTIGMNNQLKIDFTDGKSRVSEELILDQETSGHIFERTGKVKQITVSLPAEKLRQ